MNRWDDAHYRREARHALAAATHCWLCGRALTDEPYPHPLSTEADHRTPRAVALRLGWNWKRINHRSNLAAAHRICNQRRQAGGPELLARPPSPWS